MRSGELRSDHHGHAFERGQIVRVLQGSFVDFVGVVNDIKPEGKVKVMVSVFGRETPVKLDYLQMEKL